MRTEARKCQHRPLLFPHSHTHRASLFFLSSIRKGTSLRESCAHKHNSEQSSSFLGLKRNPGPEEKPTGLHRTLQSADKQLPKQHHHITDLHTWKETSTLHLAHQGMKSYTAERAGATPASSQLCPILIPDRTFRPFPHSLGAGPGPRYLLGLCPLRGSCCFWFLSHITEKTGPKSVLFLFCFFLSSSFYLLYIIHFLLFLLLSILLGLFFLFLIWL